MCMVAGSRPDLVIAWEWHIALALLCGCSGALEYPTTNSCGPINKSLSLYMVPSACLTKAHDPQILQGPTRAPRTISQILGWPYMLCLRMPLGPLSFCSCQYICGLAWKIMGLSLSSWGENNCFSSPFYFFTSSPTPHTLLLSSLDNSSSPALLPQLPHKIYIIIVPGSQGPSARFKPISRTAAFPVQRASPLPEVGNLAPRLQKSWAENLLIIINSIGRG